MKLKDIVNYAESLKEMSKEMGLSISIKSTPDMCHVEIGKYVYDKNYKTIFYAIYDFWYFSSGRKSYEYIAADKESIICREQLNSAEDFDLERIEKEYENWANIN